MESYVAQKAISFLGFARVSLDQINFEDALRLNEGHRSLSERDVERLLSVFSLEGCIREEERNFIEGLVSEERLDEALAKTGTSKESFMSRSRLPPQHPDKFLHLRFDKPIQCNDGLHRVSAAKRFLDNNDRWWIVKLYRKECESTLCVS
jgi:hypothetical protein